MDLVATVLIDTIERGLPQTRKDATRRMAALEARILEMEARQAAREPVEP